MTDDAIHVRDAQSRMAATFETSVSLEELKRRKSEAADARFWSVARKLQLEIERREARDD
ncbi:hypothetical protein [Tateyamaria sp. Alg231-49]|uniref:hypothetical protein n=1 Tax=Tateyamaria sp. Alg231-49 TaxID=1922219 RepID=UPI000D55D1EE|nr:hypothetical protein [Tateyamaria sp. Alg231-49]